MRLFRFASDELLVDRVRAGSASAFEALFDRHHRPLLAFCRHMLGSAADAEDAVQHTFMAAYADLVRSDKAIALRPWLYSIARHRCLTVLRARRERPVAELPEPETGHLPAEVDAREELRETLADIARLPEDQRAALVLAELGDVSHAEIAEVIGCRHEKVKALVFQARSTLATGRVARDTSCADIREQLAVGGVAMRRTWLRRHVRDCPGCREFDEELRLQRRRLRVLLPFAPGLGWKRAALGALWGSGGGGAASGVTAAVGTLGVGGLAATAIVSAALAGGGPPRAPAGDVAQPAVAAVGHVPGHAVAVAPGRRITATPAMPVPAAPPEEAAGPLNTPAGAGFEAPTRSAPDAPAFPTPGDEDPTSAQPAIDALPTDETGPEAPGGPAGGDKPAEAPDGGPGEPAGDGKPAGSPGSRRGGPAGGGGKPAGPSGGGKPDGPRGGGPGGPAGGGKPDGPRGGGPGGPAGGGKPDGPRGGDHGGPAGGGMPAGIPAASPGGGKPAGAPGGGMPAGPAGGGTSAGPAGDGTPATQADPSAGNPGGPLGGAGQSAGDPITSRPSRGRP